MLKNKYKIYYSTMGHADQYSMLMLVLAMNIKEECIKICSTWLQAAGYKVEEIVTGDNYQSVTSLIVYDISDEYVTQLRAMGFSLHDASFSPTDPIMHTL